MDDHAGVPDAGPETRRPAPSGGDEPTGVPEPLRGVAALGGTAVAGFAIGVAEVVPGFSGGTVALVVGLYERLIANVRQGVRALSLLVRGRPADALGALKAVDLGFVALLGAGMLAALLTVSAPLERLIEERPVQVSAALLGLVLGAAVVAARQLRRRRPWQVPLTLASAVAFFAVLGVSPGVVRDPSLLALLGGAAVAVCAWILPGVSGSFVLLVLGLWESVVGVLADRDLLGILTVALGCVLGLAAFSTLLHWLLRRAHDVVVCVLLGLMLGSVRVLWPWPADDGIGGTQLGAPEGPDALLALALALTAFALVWMFGLASSAVARRRAAPREA